MPSAVAQIMIFIGGASLLIAPGLVVLVALRGGALPSRIVLPAAVILSPAVVAAELAALTTVGLPFAVFASAAGLINLAALMILLVYCRPRISLDVPIAWLVVALLIMLPLAAIVVGMPFQREYGWHHMMQLATIESIYALPQMPEDLELAGTSLNYGWLGWAQVGALAKLTNVAPTLLFLPINIVHFLCFFILMCEAGSVLCNTAKPPARTLIGVTVGIALLSAGLLDVIVCLFDPVRRPHGDLRLTPMFSKYAVMDLMIFGMSAVALITFAMIRAVQSRDMNAATLMAVSALAAGLTYPLFLPSCAAIGGAFLSIAFAAWWFPQWHIARYSGLELVRIFMIWVLCLGLVTSYVLFMRQDAATSPVALSSWGAVFYHIKKLAWIFCLIDVPLAFIAYRAWRNRSGIFLLLIGITFGLQLPFLILDMVFDVEYKFLFVALIVTVPVLSAVLSEWVGDKGVPLRLGVGGVFLVALAASLTVLPRWHTPTTLAHAELLDEDSSEVRPRQGWHTSWIRAVRESTPAGTVLLTEATNRPIAVFAGRPLYVCADLPGEARPGYSITCSDELRVVKGYSPEEISHRNGILKIALAESITATDAVMVLDALRKLGRPVVIHFNGGGLRNWLEDRRIGRPIFRSETEVVWLIDRDEFLMEQGAHQLQSDPNEPISRALSHQ